MGVEANDLRIGNLVCLYRKPEHQDKTHHTIKSIYKSDGVYFVEIEDGFNCALTGISPIPLTEEWLLKLWFRYVGRKEMDPCIFTPCGKALTYVDSHIYLCGVCIETPILFIHQLQNLYFALTGEELKIKSH